LLSEPEKAKDGPAVSHKKRKDNLHEGRGVKQTPVERDRGRVGQGKKKKGAQQPSARKGEGGGDPRPSKFVREKERVRRRRKKKKKSNPASGRSNKKKGWWLVFKKKKKEAGQHQGEGGGGREGRRPPQTLSGGGVRLSERGKRKKSNLELSRERERMGVAHAHGNPQGEDRLLSKILSFFFPWKGEISQVSPKGGEKRREEVPFPRKNRKRPSLPNERKRGQPAPEREKKRKDLLALDRKKYGRSAITSWGEEDGLNSLRGKKRVSCEWWKGQRDTTGRDGRSRKEEKEEI